MILQPPLGRGEEGPPRAHAHGQEGAAGDTSHSLLTENLMFQMQLPIKGSCAKGGAIWHTAGACPARRPRRLPPWRRGHHTPSGRRLLGPATGVPALGVGCPPAPQRTARCPPYQESRPVDTCQGSAAGTQLERRPVPPSVVGFEESCCYTLDERPRAIPRLGARAPCTRARAGPSPRLRACPCSWEPAAPSTEGGLLDPHDRVAFYSALRFRCVTRDGCARQAVGLWGGGGPGGLPGLLRSLGFLAVRGLPAFTAPGGCVSRRPRRCGGLSRSSSCPPPPPWRG